MRIATVAVVALAALSGACVARTNVATTGTAHAVGADGRVEVEREEGGNFLVTVEATHLPPPARLGAGLTCYVVWFQAPGQQPLRVGTLAYSEAHRSGEMRATTAQTAFAVLISGETGPDVASPSDVVVFRNSVDAPSD